ncbi:MAG: ferredoxin family protein [Deltaproteobacteria bacterium]|nr:ferredoxin family protein [Deltaproteobacteria bacterium]
MARVEVLLPACTGCGVCVETCPTDVLRMRGEGPDAKAIVAYPADCQACFVCQFDCPYEAIRVWARP